MQRPVDENALISVITKRRENALRPLCAIAEITTRCQFRCVHCYQTPLNQNELTTSELKNLLTLFRNEGILYLTFGGGEPLLRRDFFELAEFACSNRFMLRLFTNAAAIDASIACRLKKLNFQSIEASLYGASPETYRRVTGNPENYDKAACGIRNLIEAGLRTVLKFPIIPENAGDLEKMESFAVELGLPTRMNFKMHSKNDGTRVECLDSESASAMLGKWFRGCAPAARKIKIDDSPCGIARQGITVGPYGDVYPCPTLRHSVGNIRSEDVYEIWENNPFLQELRTLKLSGMEKCNICPHVRTCSHCPVLAYEETGKFATSNSLDCVLAKHLAGKTPIVV